jgi:hypothetical protein
MNGDESVRINQLEWRLVDAEKSIKLAIDRIAVLEDAQRRAGQAISNLTAALESLSSGKSVSGEGGDEKYSD